jgi:hypothetical protein
MDQYELQLMATLRDLSEAAQKFSRLLDTIQPVTTRGVAKLAAEMDEDDKDRQEKAVESIVRKVVGSVLGPVEEKLVRLGTSLDALGKNLQAGGEQLRRDLDVQTDGLALISERLYALETIKGVVAPAQEARGA